jgi:hypothetical protein
MLIIGFLLHYYTSNLHSNWIFISGEYKKKSEKEKVEILENLYSIELDRVLGCGKVT